MSLHYSLVEQYRHSVCKKNFLESINANILHLVSADKVKNMGRGGLGGGGGG